ncbi:MAG TPA: RNA polymerase sigma factor [Ktedonobacteraceae bacterium]
MRHQSSTGSGQTVEELFEQHSEKLFAYLRQHTPSREDAEDILVDTFMAALAEAKFAQLPPSGQVAWLWRVARNKVADAFRKATLRRSVPLEQADETPCEEEAHDPEQMALRQDKEREIHDLLHTLPELQQEVLRLRFGYDLHCGEIAAILGKREDAVRTMLSRTMNTLRLLYAQRSSTSQHGKPDQRYKNAEARDE